MTEKLFCWECGEEITEDPEKWYVDEKLDKWRRIYCRKCYEKVKNEEAEEIKQYSNLKRKIMFRRALKKMEIQNCNMWEYQEAIEVVHEKLEKDPEKFDSMYEVLAAIMLVQNHVYAKMQYQIGKYTIDFLLPEIGVALEIDGERHKYKKVYDYNRDIDIRHALGPGWDVIRINTDFLEYRARDLVNEINKRIEENENYVNKWRTKPY